MKQLFEHWRRHLNEGGNIFKGQTDKIPLEFIQPTLDKYYEELNRLFPAHRDVFTKFEPVGSVGKKPFSGDVDLVIDASDFFDQPEVNQEELESWNIDPEKWKQTFETFKKRSRTATEAQSAWRAFLKELAEYINDNSDAILVDLKKIKAGNMFSLFPQFNPEGEQQEIGVQIDWMVGNKDWLSFSYFSDAPDPEEPNIKGLHRTQLMLSMFNPMGYTFDHVAGVKDRETKEVVTQDVGEAIKMLGDLYGGDLTREDLKNYKSLHSWLISNASPQQYMDVLDVYLRILDRTRADIPRDMQDYWISNKDRLGLTGKFLPDDSNLIKYK